MTDDKHTMGGFIPGFLTLLRFQAHHRHILGRALPKLKGHVMSVGIYTPTWSMQCFINQSLPGPPPGPHDRPDSVTPPRPRQPAPPSLLKTAPLGPGHPSCPEAAEASIPPMSDQHQHSHDGARTAPQELRQDPTQPHDPLSSVSIGSLDVQGPPEDEVTVSTGTPRLPGTPRSPEASSMPCFFTLSFLEDGPYPYPHIAQVPDSKGPEFGLQESRGCVSTPQPGL
ncbi:proline-rich proteoglycan 2-like isoform X1 [Ovis canadensis]|uniref:proline-rich proteoglycan 2-like isoform X1 n=1 Tax=Ovis canadensis TaxID=37174 RepID=UPI0005FAE626